MRGGGVCVHLARKTGKLQSMVIPILLNSALSLSRELDVPADVKK